MLPNLACRRGEGAFKSKVKTVDKKQKYSFRETDKRLKRLARRMTGKCCLNVHMTCLDVFADLGFFMLIVNECAELWF